jgi:hypothetical protein
MRSILFLTLCSSTLFGQVSMKEPWTIECGASTNTFFKTPASLNIRYISPRFKWSDYELTAEEEKKSAKFKNTRLMMELIYSPPLKVLCTGFYVQYRLLGSKRLIMDIYGGMKVFWVAGPDFVSIPNLRAGRNPSYMHLGLRLQLNLGIISPFADIGYDRILTVGTGVDFRKIYKKPKRRYKLRSRTTDEQI